ncbi:hypothetical protein Taro_015465 [Colocasia esculenta]|uniref:Glycosyltransferase n=1 Tax=Colocasia esculenta TaxID=4460 RepID=A0A843UKW7_COLES|nr:hypothetical protein [Colocasia esculenta]
MAGASEANSQAPPHIAFLPTPGMGHLIPLAEFAKRLVLDHRFTATFIMPDVPSDAQKDFLDALPAAITYIALPPANLDDLPPDVKIETVITLSIARVTPALRDALCELRKSANLVALVTDLFGTDGLVTARELGLPAYIFFPSTATALSFFLYLSELDAKTDCEYRDLPEPVRAPGCIPIHGRDLLDPVQDRKDQAYECLLQQTKRYRLADGIVLNSFEHLEPGAIKALQTPEPGKPPIYPVGPLIQTGGSDGGAAGDPAGCLKWLDGQPRGSVLFVSFGSGGTLSSEQMRELALGLEASGQRFLWVARRPCDTVANATYFTDEGTNDPLAFLPDGFLERTKEVGLVVPSWAPQVRVLSHSSTGGFLTHCGWNSTLESVTLGVPMIAWPLYAEQRMNAVMLAEDVKAAVRPRTREDGVVGREEVCRVVKALMEGEEGKTLRNRVRELQEGAARTLAEGGSSYRALAEVADKLKESSAAPTGV